MDKLKRTDLYSLEKYAELRPTFRAEVLAHKKNRQVPLGPHATVYFEDRLTMHYQVQEILRTERIFDPLEIEHELQAYNPLIPDGDNWKATFMIEFDDEDERKHALQRFLGIEDKVWARVGDNTRVWTISDEDIERSTEVKTSAVHFLRFQLTPAMVLAAKNGAAITLGIEHPAYTQEITVAEQARRALAVDLQ